jgi:hypothetical protein
VVEFEVTGRRLPKRVWLRKGRRFECAVRRVIEDAGGCKEDRKAWFQGIKDGQRDAILAAALAALPRIRKVVIDIPGMIWPSRWEGDTYTKQNNNFRFINGVLGRVRVSQNPIAPTRLPLQSLTSLTLRAVSYPKNTMDQYYVLPFLEIPSLRRIEFQDWTIDFLLYIDGGREKIPFSITDLRFRNCTVFEDFHHFLGLFPWAEKLSFGYTTGVFGSRPIKFENLLRRVLTALREDDLPMRKHLKEFRLEAPSSMGTETIPEFMFHFIKNMEVLEVLDVPALRWITKSGVLIWSKILPPSIKVLTLRHCLECTVKSLAWLLEEKNRYVPNLEVVSLVECVPMAEGEIPTMNSEVGKLSAFGMLWENSCAIPPGSMYQLRCHAVDGRADTPGPQWELVDAIES